MRNRQSRDRHPAQPSIPLAAWIACLVVWLAILCFLPDPRPLGAPASAVELARSVTGRPEPVARAIATVTLRSAAFALLGVLTAASLSRIAIRRALPAGVLLAPLLAVLTQWINYGHFPMGAQWKISVVSAVAGALVGFACRRSLLAVGAFVVLVVGLYVWGTSTRMTDDLDAAAGATVEHVLSHADDIHSGDDGFADAVQLAFSYAEDNSHHGDPVLANKAAVLALGIIFGEEKVARVAGKELDTEWREKIETLRRRVTLRGRTDSPRHFSVSAALTVLTDETRATTVGIGKELMDAGPGGSGFSFADLAANRAGILFALAATRHAESARETQRLIMEGLPANDYCPEIGDLPEGMSRDQFQAEYGGLGGKRTKEILATIDERMTTKPVLRGGP